jgi:glycerophosphoryl diester phosphodiesterase
MRRIAHRGYAGEHPENTRLSVRQVASAADAVEVDVRRCGSGDLVCLHDERVDRVTDASGSVSGFSREELASLSVLGSGEGVPTLSGVLDVIPPDVGVNVELKEAGIGGEALGVLEARPHPTVVSSFRTDVLVAVREQRRDASTVELAFLHADPGGVETATETGCELVHPHHDLCDAAYVARAHGAGLAVNAWTVRNAGVARALAGAGVDGAIADHPGVFCSA